MGDDLVKQAMAELADVVRCRCNEAYTGRGLRDPDCQCDSAEAVKVVADRIEELEDELHTMKTAGIIEVAVRNPDVSEYMAHWERRAEGAEAKLAKAACFITDIEAGPSWGESLPSWVNNRMLRATTIAELKGQDDE